MNTSPCERPDRARRVFCLLLLGSLVALAGIARPSDRAPALPAAAPERSAGPVPTARTGAAAAAMGAPIEPDRCAAPLAPSTQAAPTVSAGAPVVAAAPVGEVLGHLLAAPGWPAPRAEVHALHLEGRCGAERRRIELPAMVGPFRVVLPAGRWSLRAIAAPGHASPHVAVDVDPRRPAVLRLALQRATELCGVVRDAAGEPLSGYPVSARPVDAEAGAPVVVVHTDADGRFAIGDVQARAWTVCAGTPDRAAGPSVVVDSRTLGAAVAVDLLARDVGAVRLRLRPALAAPLVGIVVRMVPPAGTGRELRAVTGADGTVELVGLACGPWTATVQSAAGWCVRQAVDVRPGAADVVLHLAPRERAAFGSGG